MCQGKTKHMCAKSKRTYVCQGKTEHICAKANRTYMRQCKTEHICANAKRSCVCLGQKQILYVTRQKGFMCA